MMPLSPLLIEGAFLSHFKLYPGLNTYYFHNSTNVLDFQIGLNFDIARLELRLKEPPMEPRGIL